MTTVLAADFGTKIFQKEFTEDANLGALTVATVAGSVLIESIVFKMVTYHADLTGITLTGGASDVLTFIDGTEGDATNLDAADKQVSWDGEVELGAGKTLVVTLVGGGANHVTFLVTVKYRQVTSSGNLS